MTDTADILNNFSAAFLSRFTAVDGSGVHTDFYTLLQGRLYQDWADDEPQYPYAVYQIVSAPKVQTFSDDYREITIQLSLYSNNPSSAEIKELYFKASVLYDEVSISITGSTLIWIRENNLVTFTEDIPTTNGITKVRHYAMELVATIEA
jgi:hypothetical protein